MEIPYKNVSNVPSPILERLTELNSLVAEYPIKIPLKAAAKFIGMDVECLRMALYDGRAPFGICGDNGPGTNKFSAVPTVPFWIWYTQGAYIKARHDAHA